MLLRRTGYTDRTGPWVPVGVGVHTGIAYVGVVGEGLDTELTASNVERVYPFQFLLPAAQTGLERDSKAQAEQVRSLAVERVGRPLGRVPAALMLRLDEALRLHLGL